MPIALDIPPSQKAPLAMETPVKDPDKVLKSKAIAVLQPKGFFVKPNKKIFNQTFDLIKKIDHDLSNHDINLKHKELELLATSFFTYVVNAQRLNLDHLGVEYTSDNTLFIFMKKEVMDIHTDIHLDFDINEAFVVINAFENNKLALNFSSDNINEAQTKLEELFPNIKPISLLELDYLM